MQAKILKNISVCSESTGLIVHISLQKYFNWCHNPFKADEKENKS
jgi:hypothetical protein